MKFQSGDFEAVHASPIWRDSANVIFAAHLGEVDGRNEWEQLWGEIISPGNVKLCCIPFFAYGLALGDVVEIDDDYVVSRVVQRSDQLTFRVWFGDASERGKQLCVETVNNFPALIEWSSENLLAVSVSSQKAQQFADYLQRCEGEGFLQYESGQQERA
ncbi:DUF4265 domain-containing protein [Jeongeupia sp. USM3]|uniref:DUF4265 domain-containing protein n=1 Tax=Jeongeupia sp. USM3 TaxID=1906741 RepID=UPI0009F4EEE3|nr:DUF4265 domain-containing protein [Jeongeupia sp. USM3]